MEISHTVHGQGLAQSYHNGDSGWTSIASVIRFDESSMFSWITKSADSLYYLMCLASHHGRLHESHRP